jgi:DNA-binding GntR family transcriptional regulator
MHAPLFPAPAATEGARAPTLAAIAYDRLKRSIFDFELIPGDRFSESDIAIRLGMSRTPVREALVRLQREGYLDVQFKSGWTVRPLDFDLFEHLYDLRMVLETTAVRRLCEGDADQNAKNALALLEKVWLVSKEFRETVPADVADNDAEFHLAIVKAAGNPEIARVHEMVTDRLRIIRRLDFAQPARVDATYEEHAQILKALLRRRADQAVMLLKAHIETSQTEVRKITLHKLYAARNGKAAKPVEPQAKRKRR